MSIGPNVVFNCPCGHKPAPFGSNEVCQYNPPKTCGGPQHQCPICYGNQAPTQTTNDTPQNIPLQMDVSAAGEWRGIPIESDVKADDGKFGWLSLVEPDDTEADSGKKPESGE